MQDLDMVWKESYVESVEYIISEKLSLSQDTLIESHRKSFIFITYILK